MNQKKTLEIFDFDWTLFRSPHPPENVTAILTFIHSPTSLEPPNLPWRPGSEYWIENTVRAFKASQHRKDSVTVLITARRAKTKDRILDLIGQKNLVPNFAFFRSSSFQKDKDRIHFKRRVTSNILDNYPMISKITVWEDDQEQIDSLKDLSKKWRIKFEGNLVSESRR